MKDSALDLKIEQINEPIDAMSKWRIQLLIQVIPWISRLVTLLNWFMQLISGSLVNENAISHKNTAFHYPIDTMN